MDQELFDRAVRLHRAMALDEAEGVYRQVVAGDPGCAEAWRLLAVIAVQRGRYGEVANRLARVVALDPGDADAGADLGVALQASGRLAEAAEAYGRAADLRPLDAALRVNLANVLRELGRLDDAIAAYRRAADLEPDSVATYLKLAGALQEAGRAAEALAVVDQALSVDPRSGEAWRVKAELKTFRPGDPDIGAMETLQAATAGDLEPGERMRLAFALGKAWMDVPDADRAFAHLDEANRRRRAELNYDVEAAAGWMAAIAETFTPELMKRFAGFGHPSERPVFIIGMPRSGTSLVEQILASHDQVHGAGELDWLEALVDAIPARNPFGLSFPRALPVLAPDEITQLGAAYVERLAALESDRVRVIDKMPGNFHFAGLIRLMLPNARIIHCRRDPVDTCLSCYARLFTHGQDFAYDLRELGLYYRAYAGLMEHWRALLPPDRFIEVDYEAVVGDLEGQARRLVEFCGLEWQGACLAFDKTARRVATASLNQVRQPLYASSVGRWKAYEGRLGPLLAALRPGASGSR